MVRSCSWVLGILLLAAVGSACSEERASNPLGDHLPSPNLRGTLTLYASEAEQDPFAKADALDIENSHPDIYGITNPPPAGSRLIPEWAPGSSVLVSWYEDFAPYFTQLIGSVAYGTPTWVITSDLAESAAVEARLAAEDVNMANVNFFEYAHEAFWTRDYGPWSVVDPDGLIHFLDPMYYATRYRDNAVPTLLASYFDVRAFRPRLAAEGGNIMTNGAGLCVTTSRLTYNNPPQLKFELDDMLAEWLGCERTVFLTPLEDERTGHVDLLAKFLSPDVVVVSLYDGFGDPQNAAIADEAAERLAELQLADGRPLQVVRIPTPIGENKVFRTYTNALQTEHAIFVPVYDDFDDLNEQALDIYAAYLPDGVSVVPVNASTVVQFGGAIHCTTMQMHHSAFIDPPLADDAPEPWSPPEGALGASVELAVESGAMVMTTLEGTLGEPAMEMCPEDCPNPCQGGISAGCADDHGWVDREGDPCIAYGDNPEWCEDAADYADSRGVDATVACCVCGGGGQSNPHEASCGNGICDEGEVECQLGRFEIYLDIDGRNPNQVRITLSHGDVTTVLHDAADVSILDPMPSWFVTDAFMNVPDTGEWVLTVEVATHQTRAGIHRWFIRAMP